MTKRYDSLRLSLTALVVIFVAFLAAVWHTPIFDFEGSDARATVVAAALTLIGGLFATIVTGAGLVLKHSIDVRTEQRLELDSARNLVLQTDAEQRLALEAGIKAVQLLATSSGQPSPPIQQAGALFTLVSLRQYDLAIELVFGLLDTRQIRPGIASGVLDGVIRSPDTRSTETALSALTDHIENMLTKYGVAIPLSITDGTRGFGRYARERIYEILAKALFARPFSEWNQGNLLYQAYALVGALCLCWLDESDETQKANIGAVLSPVLSAYPGLGELYHPREIIRVESIRRQLEEIKPETSFTIAASLVQRAEAWVRGEVVLGQKMNISHQQVSVGVEANGHEDVDTETAPRDPGSDATR
jgi:hypothetical protein